VSTSDFPLAGLDQATLSKFLTALTRPAGTAPQPRTTARAYQE
jgi:hypothetical protein